MPLSKAENRERMRVVRAAKREGGTVLLPAAEVRRLRRQGLNITRALLAPAVTLDDYRDLGRRLEAKAARVEWQSGGIRTLRDEIATWQARYATLEASLVSERVQAARLTALEVAQAVHEAEAALQVDISMQRAEAILSLPRTGYGDDQRRELPEEEP